ncbi:MAG TPA: glycosyltransferase 87 family protein [Thermoleophilaceae bacterium]|nr:glycosyltransferase 87 family protein [Thermoleophilaceae bacterium]
MGRTALAALCGVYVALAALWAEPGSDVVLATAGGSPDWLLGPLRFAGQGFADGPASGPLFYAGLWLALLLWGAVLLRAGEIRPGVAAGAIAGLHVLFLIAPPLLSQDAFSYIAYARLGVEHDLGPYTHAPVDIPADPVFGFAGSKDAESVYGPAFTLLTYPLAPLGVPTAFWLLKGIAALSSLGVVALVWVAVRRLGRDPVLPAMFVGLNPHVVVHVVGGAHNEALVMLVVMAGVVLFLAGREPAGAFAATAAASLKASAGLVVPFLVLGARRVVPAVAGAALAGALIAGVALAAFGADALDALGVLSSNQDRTSRWSFPYKTAELLGVLLPGERVDYRDAVRAAYGVAFAAVALTLMWRTWQRRIDPVTAAAWATAAILVSSAWLVPWYALWLLPLAALVPDRRLWLTSAALSAWMLAIAVPL